MTYRTEIYYLIVTQARNSISKCWHIRFFLKPLSSACRWPYSFGIITHLSLYVYVLVSLSHQDINYTGLGPIYIKHFSLNYLFTDQTLSIYSYILRYQGWGLQHMNLQGHSLAHNYHFVLFLHMFVGLIRGLRWYCLSLERICSCLWHAPVHQQFQITLIQYVLDVI